MIDAGLRAELNERLFVGYVGGRWLAPMGQRLVPVRPWDGARMGRIACSDARDVDRALSLLAGPAPDAAALLQAYETARPLLRALRDEEAAGDPVAAAEALGVLPGQGPLVLLSAAAAPMARIVGLLAAGAARGIIWKPAPAAAASAHVLVRALAPVAGARLALLQGDHATGALLAARAEPLWLSSAPPPAGLSGPATGPHRP